MATYEGPDPHNQPKPIFIKSNGWNTPFGFIGDQKMFSGFLRELGKEMGDGGKNHSFNYMRAYRNRMKAGGNFIPEGIRPLPNKPFSINPKPPIKPPKFTSGEGPDIVADWQNPRTKQSYGNKPGMIHLDSKSFRRAQMFRKSSANMLKLYDGEDSGYSAYGDRSREGKYHMSRQAANAAGMHTDARDPRVKSLIASGYKGMDPSSYEPKVSNNARSDAAESKSTHFDQNRGKNTLPYPTAIGAKSRTVVPKTSGAPSPPRIAGRLASSILKGTGALGLLPGILHLARGGSLMDLVPPAPGSRTRYIGPG